MYMNKIIITILVIISFFSCKSSKKDLLSEFPLSFPLIHYSSAEHNVGAPVTLIYNSGTYFLFYKEFRFDIYKKLICPTFLTTSKDLIHWNSPNEVILNNKISNILNRTIVQDTESGIFYAFYVVDSDNNEENNNCYVAISESKNQGKTWTESAEKMNIPIQIKNNYNPTIIKDNINNKWLMTIVDDEQTVKIFSSDDLKNWKMDCSVEKELQYHNNIWLKATIFPINKGTNWILLVDQEFPDPRDGSSVQYFVGTYDGHKFTAPISSKSHWLDYGKDNVYNVVCNGSDSSSAPIVIGWKNNIDYTMNGSMQPFWGSLTTPRSLSIDIYSGEKIIKSEPIKLGFIKDSLQLNDTIINNQLDLSSIIKLPLSPSVITLKFKTSEKTRMDFPSKYGIQFKNEKNEKLIIGYDTFKEWYYIDRNDFLSTIENDQFKGVNIMPSYNSDSVMTLKLILDNSSVELFADSGKQAMTVNFLPTTTFNNITIFAENGIIKLEEFKIKRLNTVWNQK